MVAALKDAAIAGANIVLDAALIRCPHDTGDLQESGKAGPVRTTKSTVTAYVSFGNDEVGYASFVEFGTGIRGVGTYPYPLPTQGVPFTGGWVYDFRHQQWVGMPSEAYLRPALDDSRADVLDAFRDRFSAAGLVVK